MHEFSIVSSLLENCEKIIKDNQAKKAVVIYLEIGQRSGVDKTLLKRAFEDFKIGGVCEDAVLEILDVPVEIFCECCKESFVIKDINYTKCPKCGGEQVNIIKGRDMILKRLEME